MKKSIIIIIVAVVLAVAALVVLNAFPELENWLHNVTGWN